jgi:hypothetical protein
MAKVKLTFSPSLHAPYLLRTFQSYQYPINRTADYPKPAYWLSAGKTAVARMWEHLPMVTRLHDIPELAEDILRPTVETPDRDFITQIWNTTRSVFGSRRFVCKPYPMLAAK